MIDQLTVFLENNKGRLTALARAVGDAGINMHALALADTSDYGIVRIICDDPRRAADVLTEAGFRANTAQVIAVRVPDQPGGLADLLQALDDSGVNIEYSYCFLQGPAGSATVALKAPGSAEGTLEKAGFVVVQPADIYQDVE